MKSRSIVTPARRHRATLRLFPRQKRFVADTSSRFMAAIGGIGSGKTFVGAAKVISRISRREVGLVLAPTYRMLADTTQRTLFEMLNNLGVSYVYNKTDKHLIIPATGHEILFRSVDDPDSLRGPNIHYAWVDEAAYISAHAWRVIKGRVRVGNMQQIWITTTPKGRNWIYDEWVVAPTPHHVMYRFKTRENPMLTEEYIESLGYEGAFAAQELDGDFVTFEGLVYPHFNERLQVRHQETRGWYTVQGGDVGTRNPTAILTIHFGPFGEVHVGREYFETRLSSDEITEAYLNEYDRVLPSMLFMDPSAAAYIKSLEEYGVPVSKADNNLTFGIQRVYSMVSGHFSVDPSCVNTIREFGQYQYPEDKKDGQSVPRPKQVNDHCFVAGTRITTRGGDVSIEDVQPGVEVLTRDGYHPVAAAGITDYGEVYTVTFSDGTSLTGTANHPVWAENRGWVSLSELTSCDILRCVHNEEDRECAATPKYRNTTGRSTTDSPTSGIFTGPPDTSDTISTGRNGNGRLAKFLRVVIYTTSMAISPITTCPTFSVLLRKNMQPFILAASVKNILTGFAHSLSKPIERQNLGPRSPHTHGRIGGPLSRLTGCANTVGKLISLGTAGKLSIARANVEQRPVERPAWTTNSDSASNVGPISPLTNTALLGRAQKVVVSTIRESDYATVYNLTVSGVPEYYANGVLVHNCMDALRYGVMGHYEGKSIESSAAELDRVVAAQLGV